MSGPFDDLIPQKGGAGAFDDLIPPPTSLKLPPKPVAAAMSVNNPPMVEPGPRTEQQPPAPKPWSDLPGNILGSAGHFVKSLVQPILHPQDTVNALGAVTRGLEAPQQPVKVTLPNGQTVFQPQAVPETPEQAAARTAPANALGGYFSDRYGGPVNIRNTLIEDPVGAAADFATVLSGGAFLPGKAGQMAGTVARVVDPVNAVVQAPKAAAKVVEPIVSNALGVTTGTGKESVRAAGRAGREGGDAAAAFTDSMRGNTPIEDVVSTAKAAVDQIRQERAQAYKAGMADLSKDATVLDFKPIEDALAKSTEVGAYKGVVVNRSAGETVDKVSAIVNEWKGLDPKEFHTPEGLDALKRTIGDLRDSTEAGTPARVAADRVYNAVKGEIAKQAPEYAKTMEAYAKASDNLKEVTKTFSLGEKATGDTAARKLLSATRNNAQTNYGQRVKLIDQLAEHEPTLPYQIAGQGMNALAPRGLVGRGGVMAAGGSAIANPGNVLLLPTFSPRIVGEGAYAAGRAAGLSDKALNLLRINEANARRTGRAAYQSDRAEQR